MSKLAVRQDMPPKGGFQPIHWKRYAPKRTVPGHFIFSVVAGLGIYGFYKTRLLLFEQRCTWAHKNWTDCQLHPFIYAEDDRRLVRARKQHETDMKLILGEDNDWDVHRRTMKHEEVFVPYSAREVRLLLTDPERVALGGEPSRYSVNDMWCEYVRQKANHDDYQKDVYKRERHLE